MILARTAKMYADSAKSEMNEKEEKCIIKWCESLEEVILSRAKEGETFASIHRPPLNRTSITMFENIVRKYFEKGGYAVQFLRTWIVIDWSQAYEETY